MAITTSADSRRAATALPAVPDDEPQGVARLLRPVVASAIEACLVWRDLLAGGPAEAPGDHQMPATPLSPAPWRPSVVTPPVPPPLPSPAALALPCFEWLLETWDPVVVTPRGGHKLGRDRRPRQRNPDGRSLRQLAADWGMATHRSAALGLAAYDVLIARGVIRHTQGGFLLAPSLAEAQTRLSASRAGQGREP